MGLDIGHIRRRSNPVTKNTLARRSNSNMRLSKGVYLKNQPFEDSRGIKTCDQSAIQVYRMGSIDRRSGRRGSFWKAYLQSRRWMAILVSAGSRFGRVSGISYRQTRLSADMVVIAIAVAKLELGTMKEDVGCGRLWCRERILLLYGGVLFCHDCVGRDNVFMTVFFCHPAKAVRNSFKASQFQPQHMRDG